jgi:hypothetical protein
MHLESASPRTCARKASAPPSSGVTEGQRMRPWARARGRCPSR